ncbi:nucleotide disphospho-sugar-binding domain-containing protein [Gilvimarinus chinensis]|uniref:nucleotide disphospho-sugar-binding domain-containing protein n=1 Tax=Gilvimarinus chinensis TaxID=396005 RepID=UPI0003655EED|nr:nucleotide disphospho-sugar-binding domain-containing protein [Gilvimarinus chinensis]
MTYERCSVGFFMYPEFGAYNPTLKIANYLTSIGFQVVYFGPIDFQAHVEQHGFRYHSVLRDRLPKGTFNQPPLLGSLSLFKRLKHLIPLKREISIIYYEALASGEIEREISSVNIDLLMVDALLARLASVISTTGLPVLSLATELVGVDRYLAPHSSSLICSKKTSFLRARILFRWFVFDLSRVGIKCMMGVILMLNDFPNTDRRLHRLKACVRNIERKHSLGSLKCEYGTRPKLPEIVLCPWEFEFDMALKSDHRVYLGDCIHFSRKDKIDFPWDFFSGVPVVYCSLGTHIANYGYATHFFKQILLVAKSNQQYQFVLSVGSGTATNDYGSVPDNVLVRSKVPQLELLKRSSIMLTNGGLGTIKECILHGVPMLVLPCAFDQPGNAARVCHKGIGRVQNIRKVNADRLSKHIEALMNDKKYKRNITRLKRSIERNDNFHNSLSAILAQMLNSELEKRRN